MDEKKTKPAAEDQQKASAKLLKSFEADMKRLRKDPPTQKDSTVAFGYWIGYPSLLEHIACTDWPEESKLHARYALDAVYHAATTALAHEAGRRGIDAHPLMECGRVVMAIYRNPKHLFDHGTYDTWPECMGSWRYDLPADQQAALRDGKAAFDRLAIAVGVTPIAPSVLKGNPDAAEQRMEKQSEAIERSIDRAQEEERNQNRENEKPGKKPTALLGTRENPKGEGRYPFQCEGCRDEGVPSWWLGKSGRSKRCPRHRKTHEARVKREKRMVDKKARGEGGKARPRDIFHQG